MSTLAEQAMQQAVVAAYVDKFVAMANEHPGNPDPLQDGVPYLVYSAEKSGSKYRIVCVQGGQRMVHAFVDGTTGDLLKAASWKVPAKGVRYNLLTEWDVVEANFAWAGGYLYSGYKRKVVA